MKDDQGCGQHCIRSVVNPKMKQKKKRVKRDQNLERHIRAKRKINGKRERQTKRAQKAHCGMQKFKKKGT